MRISPPKNWRLKETLYSVTLGKCENCGNVMYPYQPLCNSCGSTNVKKIVSKGHGKLIEYTISYQSREGYEKAMPMAIGLIELDEGIKILAPLTEAEDIKEGSEVEAVLRRITADSTNGLIQYGIKFRVINNARDNR
ncbi:Zn-ribbon domain-containing OB-fold protein [Sulfurisphaera javensis]|uniref:Zn-ribbon domain-containing OB-fold protein n=1 Tax=Sulfurisphaera javensis TaxID=2049879 RepID=A0AAT9GU03_9CREN